jgi:hypothetical protein
MAGSYTGIDGTSFSAPHVAGAMALLLSAFPGMTVSELEAALSASATDLGAKGPDNAYGRGLIDVVKGYSYLKSNTSTVRILSIPGQDGWVKESAGAAGIGRGVNSRAYLYVGDNAQNCQFKAILSFDTGSIPDNAVITSATLVLTRRLVMGDNPFTTHRACRVDVVNGAFNGAALEDADFNAAPTAARIASMSNPGTDGAKSKGIFNEAGLKAINKTGLTQLRLYFALPTDDDDVKDMMVFWGDAGSEAQLPRLGVTYITP